VRWIISITLLFSLASDSLIDYRCIYSDLLAQKKDIKRHQAKLEQMAREEEEEREKAREAARERVLRDFERSQLGLASSSLHYKKELNEVAGTPSDGLSSPPL
jgi:hypothetical protein